MISRTPGQEPERDSIPAWDQRMAMWLITPLRRTAVHPNHITSLTLLLGMTSALLFAFRAQELAWLAAATYMLAVFTDHMDGALARITGKLSKFGHDYDYIVGGVNYTLLFIGIGAGLSHQYGAWTLGLGLAGGLCNPFILWMRMTMESEFGMEAVEHPHWGGFEIEDCIYLIGPITWFAGLIYFFVPYALGNIGYLIWTGWEFSRRRAKNV